MSNINAYDSENLLDSLLPKLMSGEKRVLTDESIQGVY